MTPYIRFGRKNRSKILKTGARDVQRMIDHSVLALLSFHYPHHVVQCNVNIRAMLRGIPQQITGTQSINGSVWIGSHGKLDISVWIHITQCWGLQSLQKRSGLQQGFQVSGIIPWKRTVSPHPFIFSHFLAMRKEFLSIRWVLHLQLYLTNVTQMIDPRFHCVHCIFSLEIPKPLSRNSHQSLSPP